MKYTITDAREDETKSKAKQSQKLPWKSIQSKHSSKRTVKGKKTFSWIIPRKTEYSIKYNKKLVHLFLTY